MWFKDKAKVERKYPPNRLQIHITNISTPSGGYGEVALYVTQTNENGKLISEEEHVLTTGSVIYWEKPDDEE